MTSHGGSPGRLYGRRRSSLTALIWPLPESEILVPGEKVYYRERAHWTSLFPYLVETVSIIILLMVGLEGMPQGWGASAGVIVIGSVIVVFRFLQARDWNWTQGIFLACIALVAFAMTSGSSTGLAVLAGFAAMIRLVAHYLRWAFYEDRYITNRRVLETTGFFGSRISSMPLGRVTDISLTRSVFGEVFDFGTLRVESAGQDQALGTIPYLVEPEIFHETIVLLSTETHA